MDTSRIKKRIVLGLAPGARDYLVKPIDPQELLAKIAALG